MSKKNTDVYYSFIASSKGIQVVKNERNVDEENYKYSQPQQFLIFEKNFKKPHKLIPFWISNIVRVYRTHDLRYAKKRAVEIVKKINKNKKI